MIFVVSKLAPAGRCSRIYFRGVENPCNFLHPLTFSQMRSESVRCKKVAISQRIKVFQMTPDETIFNSKTKSRIATVFELGTIRDE